jgi:hypothetical protein
MAASSTIRRGIDDNEAAVNLLFSPLGILI